MEPSVLGHPVDQSEANLIFSGKLLSISQKHAELADETDSVPLLFQAVHGLLAIYHIIKYSIVLGFWELIIIINLIILY